MSLGCSTSMNTGECGTLVVAASSSFVDDGESCWLLWRSVVVGVRVSAAQNSASKKSKASKNHGRLGVVLAPSADARRYLGSKSALGPVCWQIVLIADWSQHHTPSRQAAAASN